MPKMAGTIDAIYRYPVKGLSAEELDRAPLTPGECLPHDRRFAIALGSTNFDPEHPQWLSKTHFIMLMRDEKLAQLRTRFEAESGILEIVEKGEVLLRARMTEPAGCRLIAEFFEGFLGDAAKGSLRVVAAPGHAFADARRKPNAAMPSTAPLQCTDRTHDFPPTPPPPWCLSLSLEISTSLTDVTDELPEVNVQDVGTVKWYNATKEFGWTASS
jgi:uncharacterized protein YcbX